MKQYPKIAVTFIIEYAIMVYSFYRFSFNYLVEQGIRPLINTEAYYDPTPSIVYLIIFVIASILILKLIYSSYLKSDKSQPILNSFIYLLIQIGVNVSLLFFVMVIFFVWFHEGLIMPFNEILYGSNIIVTSVVFFGLMIYQRKK